MKMNSFAPGKLLHMLKPGFISLLLFSAILISNGCKTKQDSNKQTLTESMVQNLTDKGFVKAKILFDSVSEAPCDYMIRRKDGSLLEPLGLADSLKQDNLNIWIKFEYSRRVSRCENSMPVVIEDVRVGSP
jgi:hypothetical protein